MTQRAYIRPEELYGRAEVIDRVKHLKSVTENFTMIDIGASHNPFSPEYLTHTFDFRPNNLKGVQSFAGDINAFEDWVPIFQHVAEHGKFTFCNCTHTLEDVAYPMAALKYMPKIAKEGFIAVPSKYYELQRRELFRGAIHHRWIWDLEGHTLVGYPKVNLIDYINYPNNLEIEQKGNTEIRLFWSDSIDWRIKNNDYLGPTREHVVEMYQKLMG